MKVTGRYSHYVCSALMGNLIVNVMLQCLEELLRPAKKEGTSSHGQGDGPSGQPKASPVVTSASGEGDQQNGQSKTNIQSDDDAIPSKRQKLTIDF